jgi:hypothetical protein
MQLVGCKAQIHEAKLEKKDECRVQISSVGRKLLCEIHPVLSGPATGGNSRSSQKKIFFGKTVNNRNRK